ncbi:hypothetical protein BU17DRAFT_67102 [Hysterangium stoloniferum]|nr:hypothetical protein BU17DRAFT_67102 [Hysterangium stoloniferum]
MHSNESSSVRDSVFTNSTGSTVWGPGALSGKALKAFGELSLDMIMTFVIRRRLSIIKKKFERQPSLFVRPDVSDEVQKIELDLQELRREVYSRRIRQSAIALFIDMRTIRQRFGRIRDMWNTNPRMFTEPQNADEETQLNNIPWYSPGIQKMAVSVVHRIAVQEFEASCASERTAHERLGRPSPWKDLESNIERLKGTKISKNGPSSDDVENAGLSSVFKGPKKMRSLNFEIGADMGHTSAEASTANKSRREPIRVQQKNRQKGGK